MEENKVGKTIAILRKKKGLTQVQLAEKLYVSDKAISRWESGAGLPEIANLIELSKVFDVTIDYIVNGEGVNNFANLEQPNKTMSDERLSELLNYNLPNNSSVHSNIKTTSHNANESTTANNLNVSVIISLILAALSVVLTFTVSAIIGIVLAVVSLIITNNQSKNADLSANNASMVKIAKIVSIISIIVSAIMMILTVLFMLFFGAIYGSIISNFWVIAL